jgi:hypothetical protein
MNFYILDSNLYNDADINQIVPIYTIALNNRVIRQQKSEDRREGRRRNTVPVILQGFAWRDWESHENQ